MTPPAVDEVSPFLALMPSLLLMLVGVQVYPMHSPCPHQQGHTIAGPRPGSPWPPHHCRQAKPGDAAAGTEVQGLPTTCTHPYFAKVFLHRQALPHLWIWGAHLQSFPKYQPIPPTATESCHRSCISPCMGEHHSLPPIRHPQNLKCSPYSEAKF